MEYLTKYIYFTFPRVLCLNTSCNDSGGLFKSFWTTIDGINVGGSRIHKELETFLTNYYQVNTDHNPRSLTQISFIGSSLGGLYLRYLAKLLYEYSSDHEYFCITIKWRGENTTLQLKPINYVSLASPHLGISGLCSYSLEFATKWIFQDSGTQLVLGDPEKLLYKMASDDLFFNSLFQFKKRITYASASTQEWKVPYPSSAILPYLFSSEQNKGTLLGEGCLLAEHFDEPDVVPLYENQELYYVGMPMETTLSEMIKSLHRMSWHRVDVNLTHAQVAVVNSSREEIAKHLCKYLIME